ncbi:MAG: phage tail sheath C-terminal domain-containing protein [Pseudomonadota bacterium]
MTIPAFQDIPGNIRVPFVSIEFAPGGTPFQEQQRHLVIGQVDATASVTTGETFQVRDGRERGAELGRGMLADMCLAARRNAVLHEMHALPIAEPASGSKAVGKISVPAADYPIAAPIQLPFYVGGRRYTILADAGDDEDQVAADIAAAINADPDRRATATVNGSNANEVDVEARHKGELGNSIRLEKGLRGEPGTELAPLTFTQFSGGSGNPDIGSILDTLVDEQWDWISMPYTDATNVGHMADFLREQWNYLAAEYGGAISAKDADVSALTTFGNNYKRNLYQSIVPAYRFETPPWVTTAALGAKCAKHLSSPPELSRPLQTITLLDDEGFLRGPRTTADRFSKADRQTLYFDGISGLRYLGSEVQIERLTTMYQTNAWGDPDATYLDLNTLAQNQYGARYFRQYVTNAYPRAALADDTEPFRPGFARPKDIRDALIHCYRELCNLGVFEDTPTFARDLLVERDPVDHNRVNASLPVDHVNQFRIFAVQMVNYMQRERPGLAA